MNGTRGKLLASDQRPLQLRCRADLEFRRQTYQGRDYWIVKDPLALRYYRFADEEYMLLKLLDGKASPARIRAEFEHRFAPQRLSATQLHLLTANLFRHALVVSDAPGQGSQLQRRDIEQRGRVRRGAVANILSMRLPGLDPDRFLGGLNRWLGWLLAGPVVVAAGLLVAAALLLVSVHFDTFVRKLPELRQFFALENAGLLALVLVGTKILHELGHGLAAKRFGSQCREMGVLLLVFIPCLYCDVSDAWMVPSKWKRAAIAAAGMYFELTLAACCAFLWWFTQPGALHYLCLNVMFVCSVSTLAFNGNPLLRYDGYYILADLLEIPNLRQKSSSLLQRALAAGLCGLKLDPDPFLPTRHRPLFCVYSLLAVGYRWLVVVSIVWFLYWVLEPYGLQRIGQLLILLSMYGLLVQPAGTLLRFVRVPGRLYEVKWIRVLVVCGVVAGLMATAVVLPMRYTVSGKFEIQPRAADSVYVSVSGEVQKIHVQPGQTVCAGQPLITLANIDLTLAVQRLDGERLRLAAQLESLRHQAPADDTALQQLAHVQESLAAVQQQLKRRQDDVQRLVVRAPRAGIVYAVPPVPDSSVADQLPGWTGHPLQPMNRGGVLAEGTLVCRVGPPRDLVAVLAIDQSTLPAIKIGQHVDLYPDSLRGQCVSGLVAELSQTEVGQPLSGKRAADSSQADPGKGRGGRDPAHIEYQVRVPIAADHPELIVGAGGRGKIRAGTRTLGLQLATALRNTFRFRL